MNSLIGLHRELSDSGKAELMARRPSDGRAMTQCHDERTNVSMQSRSGIGIPTNNPCVETTICSEKPQTVDVDRSLPRTPISESPRVSPLVADISGVVMKRKGSEVCVAMSAVVGSVLGATDQVPSRTRLDAWQRGLAHLSYASMEIESKLPAGPIEC